MNGWTGKLLRVDLTARSFSNEEIAQSDREQYLGGRGLGTRLLVKEGKHLADPLSPEAAVVIASGPLNGSKAPGSGRLSMSAVSPLTNTIFDANSGGFFGKRLKGAGYDALWLEGAADGPVCLVIDPDGVRFIDATDLTGLGNEATREKLAEKLGPKYATLTIGPAGEQGSLMANIAHGVRFFGRGGLGAVFGSKNLKAVCVAGDYSFEPADPKLFDFIVNESRKLIAANPITSKGLPQFGTPVLMNVMNACEALPAKNFRESRFAGADKISGEALAALPQAGRRGCPGCPISCGRYVELGGEKLEAPEFETLWSFGADLGLDDLEGIARLNRLANDLGIDTISSGSTIAAARELFERGLLDFDPLEDGVEGLLKLLEEMATGTGRGEKLRHGSRKLGEEAGAAEVSMAVKGLEMPAYDPRGCQGQGLAYATSNRGGCHLRAYMIAPEILAAPKLVDRFATSGKAGLVIVSQNMNAAVDSLVMCRFTSFALKDDYYARLLRAATGMELDAQGLMTIGERIYNLERIANTARGLEAKDDTLPHRLTHEPVTQGPAKGKTVALPEMLEEYYRFRGWTESGQPTEKKKAELGLV